jgi:hypothetical protein
VIAHAGGLPLEETIPQLAPLVVGAAVALRLLTERARSWARSLAPRDGNRCQGSSLNEGES